MHPIEIAQAWAEMQGMEPLGDRTEGLFVVGRIRNGVLKQRIRRQRGVWGQAMVIVLNPGQ